MDICNNSRTGFTGITVTNNYFSDEDPSNPGQSLFVHSDERFNMGIYNSLGFVCTGNKFYYARCVYAPGHTFPEGNENNGWTFSHNIVYEANHFQDPDGHFAGTYDSNIYSSALRRGPYLAAMGSTGPLPSTTT